MGKIDPQPFDCPHCGAQYRLVFTETLDTERVTETICIYCDGPLNKRLEIPLDSQKRRRPVCAA